MYFEPIAQFVLDFVDVIYIFINDQKIIHIHDNVNLLVLADEYAVVRINELKVQ